MELKALGVGIGIGLMTACCAGVSFSYRYYGLDAATYEGGHLVGPTPADDLSLSACKPNAAVSRPCVVMMTSDFLAMKQDYLDTKNRLISCEKPK